MRFVMFYHSLVSDWNHGNAHFLRGVVGELRRRGHEVRIYEPREGWSRQNLLADHGPAALEAFAAAHPGLDSELYDLASLDLAQALRGADVVLVHEWNDTELVARLGRQVAAAGGPRLLFHDTHHRAVSDPAALDAFELTNYDAVLAFGASLRDRYLARGWARRVYVWHEAADTARFYPRPARPEADLVWIGNWGDGERGEELEEFLLGPVAALGLRARVYGVRYPEVAQASLRRAGIEYRGWLPNFAVPEVFARHRLTVHVPRRQYAGLLPGIPTIRPFEALACGIPLCSAPWEDREGLFRPGVDYLLARDGREMQAQLAALLAAPARAEALARAGLARIRAAHTCAHRVDELFAILADLDASDADRSEVLAS